MRTVVISTHLRTFEKLLCFTSITINTYEQPAAGCRQTHAILINIEHRGSQTKRVTATWPSFELSSGFKATDGAGNRALWPLYSERAAICASPSLREDEMDCRHRPITPAGEFRFTALCDMSTASHPPLARTHGRRRLNEGEATFRTYA